MSETTEIYTQTFDETNRHWSQNPDYNRLFLQSQQSYCNDLLHAQGHLFLNEVHDMLGLPRTPKGQLVGWSTVLNSESHVNFGVIENEDSSFSLSFNVDGVIYTLI